MPLWSKDAGIITTNHIIGTPTETVDDLEATIALHHQLQPDDLVTLSSIPTLDPCTTIANPMVSCQRTLTHCLPIPSKCLIHDTLSHEDIEHYYERLTKSEKQTIENMAFSSTVLDRPMSMSKLSTLFVPIKVEFKTHNSIHRTDTCR